MTSIGGIAMSHIAPLDLFLVLILVVVVPVQSALTRKMLARAPGELRLARRYGFNIVRATLLSLLVLLAWHWSGRTISGLGLDIPVGFRGRIGFALDVVLIAASAFALLWREPSKARIESMRRQLEQSPVLPKTPAQFRLFVLMVLVASPAEELLYRGFLLWVFAIPGSIWAAALMSSLVFGLGHAYQGWRGIVRTALIGFLFAIAFVLTRSLWWLMLAHSAINLLSGTYAWRVMRHSQQAPP